MKPGFQKFQFLWLLWMVLIFAGCKVTSLPDVTDISESADIGSSVSIDVLIQNDYREPIAFLEETAPDWIEIRGLDQPQLWPGEWAQLTLVASCGLNAGIYQGTIELRSFTGSFSKVINVELLCENVYLYPQPVPWPMQPKPEQP